VVPDDPDLEPDLIAAVRAVRAGNVEAYATIVKRFQGPLMTLCTAILRDGQAADELTQDVLVRAYQRLDSFDERRPLKTWLVKIAYRLAQERWRSRVRETAHQEAAATSRHRSRSDSGPAARLLADEQSEMLWQAVYALPMAQRTAVVLYALLSRGPDGRAGGPGDGGLAGDGQDPPVSRPGSDPGRPASKGIRRR